MTNNSPGEGTERGTRPAFPAVSLGAALGAALAFAGVAAIAWNLGGNGAGLAAGAVVSLLAGLLAIPPLTRTGSLLLLWNALGIGCAMFVLGLFSVGALVAFPLVLLAIALASWPRRAGESIASGPAIAVQAAGFLLVFLIAGFFGEWAAAALRLVGI